MKLYFSKINKIIFVVGLLLTVFVTSFCYSQTNNQNKVASETLTSKNVPEGINIASVRDEDISRYVDDSASIIGKDYIKPIAACGIEIEKQGGIRVFIKTQSVKDLNDGQLKADALFSDWIRSIGIGKKGI